MHKILRSFANLLSMRPGEGTKTLLLYSLQLVFFLGLMWGDTARESLFLSYWGADDLAYMFILNALLGFFLGLVYTFFADRVNNTRLLFILTGILFIWLFSVRILMQTQGGPRGMAYPYFYVSFVAFRDLATLHLVTFINDFFDTRSAKRLLPLLLSAGVAGGTLAGFSGPLLNHLIGLENVPLAWAVCLSVVFLLQLIIQRRLKTDLELVEKARQAAVNPPGASALENLYQGFRFVSQSTLLRWLALASFLLMVMLNLLFFQSSHIFVDHFANDRAALFNFYNLLGALGNITGLLIQSLLLGRLVARFGVGSMNLFFPVASLLAAGFINLFPSFATGILTRLDTTLGRQAFRNPLDAMLYNSVPLDIKTRARGFVSSLIIPLGTFTAGVTILAIKFSNLPSFAVTAITVGSSAAYFLSMIKVRQAYGHALAGLLARDEVSIFRLSTLDSEQTDPATMEFLYQRMRSTTDPRQALLIAEMVYQIEERSAFPELLELARERGPEVRVGIIRLLTSDWLTDPGVLHLCQDSLADANASVQHAAVQALLKVPDLSQESNLVDSLSGLLERAQVETQALVIPVVLNGGSPSQRTAAHAILSTWLTSAPDQAQFGLALQVLAQTGDSRLQAILQEELFHPEISRRHRTIPILSTYLAVVTDSDQRAWALQSLDSLLSDSVEHLRMEALQVLLTLPAVEIQAAIWQTLGDASLMMRQLACEAANFPPRKLEEGLSDPQIFKVESCALLLTRRGNTRGQHRLLELAVASIRQIYTLHQIRSSFQNHCSSAASLLDFTLLEAINALLDRIFWLLTATSDAQSIENIRRALSSSDPLTRANATEALDSLASPALAFQLTPLVDGSDLKEIAQLARSVFNVPEFSVHRAIAWAWPAVSDSQQALSIVPSADTLHPDGWLAAISMLIARDIPQSITTRSKPFHHFLETSLQDPRPLVRQTANTLLLSLEYNLSPAGKEKPMLSLIEKVIFLQEVPFFKDMPLQELRILASIAEEKIYAVDDKVFSQGDATSSLYVIVSGRVAVQQHDQRTGRYTRLTELNPGDYFAEVSLFDEEPHSADTVALTNTDLLIIRRSTLVALVRNQPEMSLTLLKALSQRLRQAYADMNAIQTQPVQP